MFLAPLWDQVHRLITEHQRAGWLQPHDCFSRILRRTKGISGAL